VRWGQLGFNVEQCEQRLPNSVQGYILLMCFRTLSVKDRFGYLTSQWNLQH
jgi:hypothetical protein